MGLLQEFFENNVVSAGSSIRNKVLNCLSFCRSGESEVNSAVSSWGKTNLPWQQTTEGRHSVGKASFFQGTFRKGVKIRFSIPRKNIMVGRTGLQWNIRKSGGGGICGAETQFVEWFTILTSTWYLSKIMTAKPATVQHYVVGPQYTNVLRTFPDLLQRLILLGSVANCSTTGQTANSKQQTAGTARKSSNQRRCCDGKTRYFQVETSDELFLFSSVNVSIPKEV